MAAYPYRKSDQIQRYISQFMRVFKGFQVEDGVDRGTSTTRPVPLVYGSMDRVIAARLAKNHKNRASLPLMAVNKSGLTIDNDARMSNTHVDYTQNKVGDGSETINRLIGPPFLMNMELMIFASSQTELFQIVEPILLIFNPTVTIQVDVSAYNADYLTEIRLVNISPEISYPLGTDSRTTMFSMTFEVPIRLRYPHGSVEGIIEEIKLNIYDKDSGDELFEDTIDEDDL